MITFTAHIQHDVAGFAYGAQVPLIRFSVNLACFNCYFHAIVGEHFANIFLNSFDLFCFC